MAETQFRLLVVDRHGYGGTAVYAWALAGALGAEGFDVSLLSPRREPSPAVGGPLRVIERLPRPVPGSGRVSAVLRAAVAAAVIFVTALSTRCRTVVFMVNAVSPEDAALVRALRFMRRRVVLVAHNVVPHGSDRGAVLPGPYRVAYGQADAIVTLCEAERDRLVRMSPPAAAKTAVIPHGEFGFAALQTGPAEETRRRLGVPEDRPLLLCFGRLLPYKGIDDLLDALVLLRDRAPLPYTVIAGESPGPDTEPALRARIRDLSLTDDVLLQVGYVSPQETADLFAACDAVVLPYREATQSGVVMLAYSYGRPVVVTDVGGLPEYVDEGETGEIAPANDPAGFADAVERLIADTERLAARKASISAASPRRFEWDVIAARFIPVLRGRPVV